MVRSLSLPSRGRAACYYCGPCERGCITRSYIRSVNATLPAATKTGRMTLRPYSVVHTRGFTASNGKSSGTRISPTLRSQSPITRASSANAWETPVRAAWTGKQNTAYPLVGALSEIVSVFASQKTFLPDQ